MSSPETPAGRGVQGLVFGKYEILRRLAIGGMGEVFLARQTVGFQRLVILKSLLPELAQREGFIDQFLDEARVAATVNHPNVVSMYEVGLWEGVHYIAMEYIAGVNLAQLSERARRQGLPLPAELCVRIIHDAAQGLAHAHRATDLSGQPLNLVHRDISPQNLMVRLDGLTKVVDFGIARAANRSARTRTGELKGKIGYMAPEQVRAAPLDARTDQFALGVVFWELCTGRALFTGRTDIENFQLVLFAPIDAPSAHVAGFSAQLDAVVLRMLRRDPAERFLDLAQVAAALESWLQQRQAKASSSELSRYLASIGVADTEGSSLSLAPNYVVPLAPAAAPRKRPRLPIFVLAGGLSLLAAGGAAVAIRSGSTQAPPGATTPPVVPAVAALPVVPAPPEALAPAVLSVTSIPPGAAILLDGESVGLTPRELQAEARRRHIVQLDLPRHRSTRLEVQPLEPGERFAVNQRLAALATAVAPPRRPSTSDDPPKLGWLYLETTPWTRVTIDGVPADSTPLKRQLAAGPHRVELVNEQAKVRDVQTLVIPAGGETRLRFKCASGASCAKQ